MCPSPREAARRRGRLALLLGALRHSGRALRSTPAHAHEHDASVLEDSEPCHVHDSKERVRSRDSWRESRRRPGQAPALHPPRVPRHRVDNPLVDANTVTSMV